MAAILNLDQIQCQSCGGIYAPVQADGMAYFHACSPVGVDAAGATIERPNKRDENFALTNRGKLTGIKADGDGTKAFGGGKLKSNPLVDKLLKSLQEPEAN